MRVILRVAVVLSSVVVLVLGGSTVSATPLKLSSISGTVTFSDIPYAPDPTRVVARKLGELGGPYGDDSTAVSSDISADGSFLTGGLQPGRYILTIYDATGFAFTRSAPIEVSSGQNVEHVVLNWFNRSISNSSISGHVFRAPVDIPPEKIKVKVFLNVESTNGQHRLFVEEKPLLSDYSYTVSHLPPAGSPRSYHIEFSIPQNPLHEGRCMEGSLNENIDLKANSTVTVNCQMYLPKNYLSGKVALAEGVDPVALELGVVVEATTPTNHGEWFGVDWDRASINRDGSFSFSEEMDTLPLNFVVYVCQIGPESRRCSPGSRKIYVPRKENNPGTSFYHEAKFFKVDSKSPFRSLVVNIDASSVNWSPGTGSLSGKVSGRGGPGPGSGRVILIPDNDVYGQVVKPGIDGHFRFDHVDPGRYRVFYSNVKSAYAPGVTTYGQASIINIAEGQSVTGVNIDITKNWAYRPQTRISGEVRGLPQEDLDEADIYLRPREMTGNDQKQKLKSDGTFSFNGVSPSSYEIIVSVRGRSIFAPGVSRADDAKVYVIQPGRTISGAIINWR